MNLILSIGILIFAGYLAGEWVEKWGLPRISGYILAGILLNPGLTGWMTEDFVERTGPLLTMALALITFTIGASLSYEKLSATGKMVIGLVICESLAAFLIVFLVLWAILSWVIPVFGDPQINLVASLILASLAAPTDPSATLAVKHEYQAKGEVSDTMLEVAALDDIMGVFFFTVVTALAVLLMEGQSPHWGELSINLLQEIGGAILLGALVGLVFNAIGNVFQKQSEGSLIVLIFGLVFLCYGLAELFAMESILATMSLGAMIANFNPLAEKIFQLIERYTDELIFVVFFTLSGLQLQLSYLGGSLVLIIAYMVARFSGKYLGVYAGATWLGASSNLKRYLAGGLLPQGGIVIGLALLISRDPAFTEMGPIITGVVVGAALVHEVVGPVVARRELKKAGEFGSDDS